MFNSNNKMTLFATKFFIRFECYADVNQCNQLNKGYNNVIGKQAKEHLVKVSR